MKTNLALLFRSARNCLHVLMFLMIICSPYSISAQVCAPEADFTYTVSGCDVSFTSLYLGPGTATHKWEFYNTSTGLGPFSSTTVSQPSFTFDYLGGTTKFVRHTITITLPGGSVVVKVCEKLISTMCTENNSCYTDYYFYYEVIGCTVTITYLNSPIPISTWDFGDGSPIVASPPLPSHTYATSGTYLVTVNLNEKTCTMVVEVGCDDGVDPSLCCNADFNYQIINDCGILRLKLKGQCPAVNNHQWTITPSTPGVHILNFFPAFSSQDIVLTNINTVLTPSLTVTHSLICNDGTVVSETKIIYFSSFDSPTNPTIGIFIGVKLTTHLLTSYSVLPGASIASPIPVFVAGYITIDKAFTFTNTDIQFHSNFAGFNVSNASYPFELVNSNLHATNGCPCLWRGIEVTQRGILRCNSGTIISDALYGIRIRNSNPTINIDLNNVRFNRNYVGIRGANNLGLTMQQTIFNGQGPLLAICDLVGLNDLVAPSSAGNFFTQPITPVFYSNQNGFAGMYIENAFLNMPAGANNAFQDLAYGIMTSDCNVQIRANSTFMNIAAGGYGYRRTAGIFFRDTDDNAANDFNFIGNGGSDFTNCVQGMQIRSETPFRTRIGISNTGMNDVRTGIFLDARFGGGEFLGSNVLTPFIGIQNNIINATLPPPLLLSNGGITFLDFSPGESQVEISNNEVNISSINGPMTGGFTGIAIDGMLPTSDPGPGIVEADVHDNIVNQSNGGEIGIGTSTHPNVWIRNNILSVLDGITSWSGIKTNYGGNTNMVACNRVTVAPTASVTEGLLHVDGVTNSQFLRNTFNGAGNGAHFEAGCTGTEYRCNLMENNTTGLFYDNAANTGDQGTPTTSNGNQWVGGGDAEADLSVPYINSRYFVRPVGDETPSSVIPPINTLWFFQILPTANVECLIPECPSLPPDGFEFNIWLTPWDTLVAEGLGLKLIETYSASLVWQHEYHLFRKLIDYPDLVQNNVLMQNFQSSLLGSNTEAFCNIQVDSRIALTPGLDVLSEIHSNMDSIVQTENEIAILDSLLNISVDSLETALLFQELSVKIAWLDTLLSMQETIIETFNLERATTIADYLDQLNSKDANNTCESNLKRFLEIYYQTVASNLNPDSILLEDLESIAIQCPKDGGPGVYAAGALYQGLTGILPISGDCSPTPREGVVTFDKPSFLILPNPNQGSFSVNIPLSLVGEQTLIRVVDARGIRVKDIPTQGEQSVFLNLGEQINGLYFVLIVNSKATSKAQPFIIQH